MAGSRKDQKFANEQEQIETHKKFEPTYPGEKGLDLDPETIARLEAQKQAMLSTLPVEPRPAPGASSTSRVVEELPAPAETLAPIVAPEPGALDAAKATVSALQEKYRYESETRELEFKNKLAAALAEQGRLETATAVAIDAEAGSRLKEVLASVRDSSVTAEVREAKVSVGSARQEDLRRRAAPTLAIAAQERKLLAGFKREYGEALDELRAISRSEWLLGTPSDASGAHLAAALYTQLENGLNVIQQSQESLEQSLRTDVVVQREGEVSGGWTAEIERLIKSAATGWDQNDERAWTWAVTRLAKVEGGVETMQLLVKGVTGSAARLRNLRSPANTERASGIAMLPERPRFPTVDTGAGWSGLTGGR